MTRRDTKDYGKIIEFDPEWKGPLEVERKQTDYGFLILLIIYEVLRLCIAIYAFSTGEVDHAANLLDIDVIFPPSARSATYIALGFTMLGIIWSFTYIFLLRFFAKAVVFTVIFSYCAFLLVIIGFFVYIIDHPESHIIDDTNMSTLVNLCFCVILFIVIVVCSIIYRKKITIACRIIRKSTKAVMFFPSSFLFPILPIIWYGTEIVIFGLIFIYLAANPAMQRDNVPIYLYLLHGINIFGLFWMSNFILAFSKMVLSGTFATWYWTMDKKRVPRHTILKFMYITTRFHLGSIAFGSLIIAIVEAIKVLVRFASGRSRNSGNNLAALLFNCIWYVSNFVEGVIEFINTNAYIMCTIHGTEFIQSAKDAFNLIMRNIMKVLVTMTVTHLIIFMGLLHAVALSALTTYAYCRNMEDDVQIVAIIVAAISTFIVSGSILNVLHQAINTIFLCVLEDYERNDGSDRRPYFMTYQLKEMLIQDT